MKISKLIGSVLLAALAYVSLPVVQATPVIGPPSTYGGKQGKGASTDKYTAAYGNPIGGTWLIKGVRVVNKNYVQDSFTAIITDLASLPPGVYSYPSSGFWWSSDYDGQVSFDFVLTVVDNGDGTGTVTGVVYY